MLVSIFNTVNHRLCNWLPLWCSSIWIIHFPLVYPPTVWIHMLKQHLVFNTLRPRQNGRHFADDTFKRIFLNEIVKISIQISLKFVPKGPINNIPALDQIMAWRRSGDKPLSEQMMVSWLTHICVTRPQWVKMTIVHIEPCFWSFIFWYYSLIHNQ